MGDNKKQLPEELQAVLESVKAALESGHCEMVTIRIRPPKPKPKT